MINHSVCFWPFAKHGLPALIENCRQIGIAGIDLLTPAQSEALAGSSLVCPITAAPDESDTIGSIENALNNSANLERLVEIYSSLIPSAASAGIDQVICFSGNREGRSDAEGLQNCAAALQHLIPIAERHSVRLVMELLNSKVDHPDYQADHTRWGVDLCEKVGSVTFGLLYDVYHMQVMEGDIIATIRDFHKYIAHYHTAGCPGRNELGLDQELYYPAIMRAIAETGFTGYVAHEFIPTAEDPFASLAEAVRLCSLG